MAAETRVTQVETQVALSEASAARVTQVETQVALSQASAARVTQSETQVAIAGAPNLRVTHLAVRVLRATDTTPPKRVTTLGAEVVVAPTDAKIRVTQLGAEAVVAVTDAKIRVTQLGAEAVVAEVPSIEVGYVGLEIVHPMGTLLGGATATGTATAVASKLGPEFIRLTADGYLREDLWKQTTADAYLEFVSTTVQVSTVGLDVLYIVHPPVRVTWTAVSAFASDTATKARISDLKVSVLGRMATIPLQISDMKVYVLGRRASGEARVTQLQQSVLAPLPHEDTYVIWWY